MSHDERGMREDMEVRARDWVTEIMLSYEIRKKNNDLCLLSCLSISCLFHDDDESREGNFFPDVTRKITQIIVLGSQYVSLMFE